MIVALPQSLGVVISYSNSTLLLQLMIVALPQSLGVVISYSNSTLYYYVLPSIAAVNDCSLTSIIRCSHGIVSCTCGIFIVLSDNILSLVAIYLMLY